MKSFVHFGEELYLDCSNAHPYGTPDMTMAHMHSCYELLMVLDPIPYSSVIDGKIFHGKRRQVYLCNRTNCGLSAPSGPVRCYQRPSLPF